MMNVGNSWRVDTSSKAFISVPTPEQLERLPDPDGNYTEAQIRRMREKRLEGILEQVKQYLDLESSDFDQRCQTIDYCLLDETEKEIRERIYVDVLNMLNKENEDLKSRIKQLATALHEASRLADFHAHQTGSKPW